MTHVASGEERARVGAALREAQHTQIEYRRRYEEDRERDIRRMRGEGRGPGASEF